MVRLRCYVVFSNWFAGSTLSLLDLRHLGLEHRRHLALVRLALREDGLHLCLGIPRQLRADRALISALLFGVGAEVMNGTSVFSISRFRAPGIWAEFGRVRAHLREFFLVRRLPLCSVGRDLRVRLLLGLPQPRRLLCRDYVGWGGWTSQLFVSVRRGDGGVDGEGEKRRSYPDARRSRWPVPPARRRGASGSRPEIPWRP